MTTPRGRVLEVKDLRPGDHVCFLWDTEAQHQGVVTRFVTDGLRRGEKVLYLFDAYSPKVIEGYLLEAPLKTEPPMKAGSLSFSRAEEAYMQQGGLAPGRMAAFLREETDLALAQGYSALRVTCEMSWLLRVLPGADLLAAFKKGCDAFFLQSRCLMLCQYCMPRFPPGLLLDVLRSHPVALIGGVCCENPHYIPSYELHGPALDAVHLRRYIEGMTERRRTEEAMGKNEEELTAIYENAPVILMLLDKEGRIRKVNRRGAAFSRRSEGEILGMLAGEAVCCVNALYTPSGCGKGFACRSCGIRLAVKETLETGRSHDRREAGMKVVRNGVEKERNFLISTTRLDVRSEHMVLVSMMDITERVEIEKALKLSEEKYRLLVEHGNDAIFVAQDERLTFANASTERLMGYSRAELEGMPLDRFLHPKDRDMVLDRHRRRIQGDNLPNSYVFRLVTKAGEERTVQVNAVRIVWEGRPATLSFLRDITELRRLETMLQQTQKMEALGTLAGGIAHDFNNTLGTIMGYTEMALQELPGEDTRLGYYLGSVLKAGERARDLVTQILTFCHRGKTAVQPLRLGPVVREMARILRPLLPTTIEIRQHLKTERDLVLADPTQMHQVIMNLCTNAAHAMRDTGGLLTLTLGDGDRGPGEARGTGATGPSVALTVEDTGCGIEEAILPRIFEPFFTTKRPGEGSGMGLAVVHGIVTACGGEIQVQCAPGKGSRFRVVLPLLREGVRMTEKGVEGPPVRGKGRILCVDDDPSLKELMGLMLRSLGYDVTATTIGMEALELFLSDPLGFDLAVLDLTMPHLTGLDLAREMMDLRPGFPVILVTGFSESIDKEKARTLGMREFLLKPVTTWRIADAIARVLRT